MALSSWFVKRLTAPRRRYHRFIYNSPEMLKATIAPGDVLLVEGDQRISQAIKYLTMSSWSHSALFIGDALLRRDAATRLEVQRRFGREAKYLVVEALVDKGVVDFSRHPHVLSRAAPRTTFSEVPPGTRIGVTGMRPGGEVISFEVPPPPITADVTVGSRHRQLTLYVDAIDLDAEMAVARIVYRALFSYPRVRYEKSNLYVRPSADFEKLLP